MDEKSYSKYHNFKKFNTLLKINTNKLPDNQLALPNGKIITFNNQQYEGINKIRRWLKTKNQPFFTISGYAGTGKTLSIKKILDEYNWGVVVSAPTHKAVKVIRNITNKEGQTLHSLLGLRPDVELSDFNPNAPQFNPIAVPKITDYNLVILDECSMVNKSLFELIQEKIKNSNTKILFVGDSAQLPPVSEDFSVVFSQSDIEIHELTKVERQDCDNPLMLIYDMLRNNLEKLDGGYKRKTNILDSGEGIIFIINKIEFRKAVLEKFNSNEFKKDSDYCKGLAWKNETVMASNNVVRTEIFGKNSNIIEIGDILTAYRSVNSENQRYNIIENSADYHVIEKSNLEENKYEIKGFCVKLREDLAKKEFKFLDVFIIDANNHDNLHHYAEMHDFFRDMGKTNKKLWTKYYDFRRCNLLMKTIYKYKNGLYRSNCDIINKDLDYGYFLTIHKSQGSTYQHVMVIENDLNLNWNIIERNKLRYVAFSRPEKTCTVLTTRID
jgi:ATP-dependent exoDNAse (exonuclease V) alpha subunit